MSKLTIYYSTSASLSGVLIWINTFVSSGANIQKKVLMVITDWLQIINTKESGFSIEGRLSGTDLLLGSILIFPNQSDFLNSNPVPKLLIPIKSLGFFESLYRIIEIVCFLLFKTFTFLIFIFFNSYQPWVFISKIFTDNFKVKGDSLGIQLKISPAHILPTY